MVICSKAVRGYLRQLSGLNLYIAQRGWPSSSYRKAGHTFGSLQQSPHRTHSPILFLLTGKIAVNVRKIRENQLFFILIKSYEIIQDPI
ncbi:hypothetical protein [Candidatus Lokiarchaeum ossiferum]|uniref:hypothetical protein n=1 Tax=Candidatus Lokiarchaeum ossiferum TaxID=2951803 RepID=UPI00352F84AD